MKRVVEIGRTKFYRDKMSICHVSNALNVSSEHSVWNDSIEWYREPTSSPLIERRAFLLQQEEKKRQGP